MLSYFVRRLMGGVATFLLATFILYTALIQPGMWSDPNPGENDVCLDCPRLPFWYAAAGNYAIFKLDRPWPSNYLAWLYDPQGDRPQTFTLPEEQLGWSESLPAKTVQFTSVGILRGDFGQSLRVQPGTLTLTAYGIELLPWTVFIGTLLFGSMTVASLQRRGRGDNFKAQRVRL